MYIDESGFAHDMPRRYGYACAGQRCYGVHNWHARGRTAVIGALIGKNLLTVGLFDANVDADVFTGWARQDRLPKLPPASIIVMDNATFHKRLLSTQGIRLSTCRPRAQTSIRSSISGRKPHPSAENQGLLSRTSSPDHTLNHF